jgi:hypothetical protein
MSHKCHIHHGDRGIFQSLADSKGYSGFARRFSNSQPHPFDSSKVLEAPILSSDFFQQPSAPCAHIHQESATAVKSHIFQLHSGFKSNKLLVFINMAAIWVRTVKPNPRSLLLSIQFGFGPTKNRCPALCQLPFCLPDLPIARQEYRHRNLAIVAYPTGFQPRSCDSRRVFRARAGSCRRR